MKTMLSLLSTLMPALALTVSTSLQAQTWENVYHPDLGGVAGVSGDIGTDAVGNVYAVGRYIAADGSSKAIVQESFNQGASWVPVDQYFEAGLNYSHHRAFAAHPTIPGHLLAGGNLNHLLPDGTYEFDTLWIIRERDPETGVWATAEDFSALVNDVGQASCADLMVSPSGDVYATGGGQLGWVVRKRPSDSTTFTTVDADYSGQSTGSGWDMAIHPSYGVFAVGEVNGVWTVRRSPSGNLGTWTTVDSFYTARAWTGGKALCILTTPSKIHVVGSAYKYRNGTYWIVRSSSDGGQTWAITDDYAPSIPSEARGIVQDASGNLWVCGTTVASAGGSQWVVRKGTPGTKLVKQGKNWVQVETITWTNIGSPYQLAPGKSAQPNGITTDSAGNIFVCGAAKDANGVDHWIVRKLTMQ